MWPDYGSKLIWQWYWIANCLKVRFKLAEPSVNNRLPILNGLAYIHIFKEFEERGAELQPRSWMPCSHVGAIAVEKPMQGVNQDGKIGFACVAWPYENCKGSQIDLGICNRTVVGCLDLNA